ncbi:MAG TPA: HypC/HybG/HupF family hydrogenase formation chaperone [Actinomycetes bacterium]|nr:HypC/HybG/HupF family hydrogenase formation chaperone [Actinomycetes bacterium]
MCLGAPCQVVSVGLDRSVVVRDAGRQVPVCLLTLEGPVDVDDWLLVHCGLALARLTEPEALDALSLRTPEESP